MLDPPTYSESDIALSNSIFTGSSFNHGGLTPDRWHHYWVRGTNAYGQSDWLYLQTGTTKEQDLVTTVVERLEAIEVVSSNFDGDNGSFGYKLYGPNPNNPSEEGRAVFNDVIARGKVESSEIISRNFNSGVSGYRLDPDGNAEFQNGVFRGTIYADEIIGDLVSATSKSGSSSLPGGWANWGNSVTVRNNTGDSATVEINGGMLSVSTYYTGNSATNSAVVTVGWRLLRNGSVVSNTSFTQTARYYSQADAVNIDLGVSLAIPCPTMVDGLSSSQTGYYTYQLQTYYTISLSGGSHSVTNNTSGSVVAKLYRDGGAFS